MIRNNLTLASDALERQVIRLWSGEGYARNTIHRRLLDKRRIYRRLGTNQPVNALARRLCFETVHHCAQQDARRWTKDRKLHARVTVTSLRAWADALRALGKPVPPWKSETPDDLIDEYWSYTRRLRALAENTSKYHRRCITSFLEDLTTQKIALHAITLADVDRFVSTLTTNRELAVKSAANVCICVRHFLRFLYRSNRHGVDLAPAVIGPTTRQMLKRPPERVSWTTLKKILKVIDRTQPLGKRDFAILVTAASYGWGSADVLSLRLDDIDWRRNRLSIIRPKTSVRIEVPLRPEVAHALAEYIETARPANTGRRVVFLRQTAPWAKPLVPNAIAANLRRYAKKAGVSLPARCSMKAFRCAHIAEQLNRGVSPKVVIDVVGHSDTRSLSKYGSINIEQLRHCALAVPK